MERHATPWRGSVNSYSTHHCLTKWEQVATLRLTEHEALDLAAEDVNAPFDALNHHGIAVWMVATFCLASNATAAESWCATTCHALKATPNCTIHAPQARLTYRVWQSGQASPRAYRFVVLLPRHIFIVMKSIYIYTITLLLI